MILNSLLFLSIHLLDVIDILLVAFLLYQLYYAFKKSVAISVFFAILFFYALWVVVNYLQMELLGTILKQFINIGAICIIIIFQQEIRRFLLNLSSSHLTFHKIIRSFQQPLNDSNQEDIDSIITAMKQMGKTYTGALIILQYEDDLTPYIETGQKLDATISEHLIESIFFKNNPLHDGAIILLDGKVKAARCILPLTQKDMPIASMGLRHRAAMGISEQYDCIALVVSEQTGALGLFKNGVFSSITDTKIIKDLINS